MTRAGIIRAEGQVVSSAGSSDKIVIQQFNATAGYYEPKEITVGNLITGGGTGFTEGAVIFADSTGSLATDPTNLSFNDSTNVLTANSITSNGNVIMSAAGTGLQVKEGSNARMGTATLSSGTVTVSNTSVTANTRIFLSRYAIGASSEAGVLSVGTVTASTSFVINSLDPTDASVATGDVSVVHWLLIEPSA